MAQKRSNCPNDIKKLFFPNKIKKKSTSGRVLCTRIPIGFGGSAPKLPSLISLSYPSLLTTSPIFIISGKHFNFRFKLFTFGKILVTRQPRLLIFHSTAVLSPKKTLQSKISDNIITLDFAVCPSPPIKNPGYAYEQYPKIITFKFRYLSSGLTSQLVERLLIRFLSGGSEV